MPDDNSPLEINETDEPTLSESVSEETVAKSNVPPVVALSVVIIALFGVLAMLVIKSGVLTAPASSDRLAALQAEVDASRSEINRQRAAFGHAPLEGNAEPIEVTAGRLKKDADSLVTLAGGFQQMLDEKDTALAEKSAGLIGSEKSRIALTAENTRLQTELTRVLASGSDTELLRRDLATLGTQRDALSAELVATKLQLQEQSVGISSDDFADLKRRYEETLRAKEFFEARVKELEGDKK